MRESALGSERRGDDSTEETLQDGGGSCGSGPGDCARRRVRDWEVKLEDACIPAMAAVDSCAGVRVILGLCGVMSNYSPIC